MFTRRKTMAIGVCTLGFFAFGMGAALAAGNNHQELISKFTKGKKAVEGKIKLKLPEIAENGNTVPLELAVDSPMTKDNYVKRVMVVADGNPSGGLATFNFNPSAGIAAASTRVRLAGGNAIVSGNQKGQNIIAVAEMSDGSFYKANKFVKVTIGGCGG